MSRASNAGLRPALLAVAATGALVAVVVAASRAHLFGDSPAVAGPGVRRTALDTVFYLGVLYVLAVAALIVWAFWPDERLRATPLERRSLFRTMVVPLFFTFALGLLLSLRLRPYYSAQPFGAGAGLGGAQAPLFGSPGPSEAGGSGVDWAAVAIVLLLVALAGGALWRHERARRRRAVRPSRKLAKSLEVAVGEGLDQLLAEADARRAVIAAYAAMERSLARGGHGRRRAEAPLEYLARILSEVELDAGPAARLTDLYETAKFSVHPMGSGDRSAALGALEALRAELARREEVRPALL